MNFKKKIAATVGLAMGLAMCVVPGVPAVEAEAASSSSTLVWSDEFNSGSLDTSKWTCEIGNGSGGWGNNELEYYTDRSENVAVRDGSLVITARKENYNGYNYTSARLKTQDKFRFTYGHVEARIALPSGNGIWPAFWMLGQNIGSVGWPRCGEIDIIEAINAENKVYGTCHWDSNGHAEYGNSSGTFDITQFHNYTLDWDDQYIRMYVDGNRYHEIYIGGNAGNTEELHQEQFLLLNVAVGGNWPGFNIDNSRFPQQMKVDYIRVYQDRPNFTSTSPNPVDGNTGSGNGGGSGSGNGGSNNTASGKVYIYQDINYGGRSASLGVGDYNLSSLQAKGFRNDDLTSLKVPFGYKVTLYEHDNFGGASRVIRGDSSWIGNDFNDKTSSIRVEKVRYRIINRNSGLALDVSGGSRDNGANVQQWTPNGTDAQTWYVEFNPDDSTFVVTSALNGKALDMGGWSTENGGNLIMWDNNNTANQRWYITSIDNGYSFLINKHSNKAMDVADVSTAAGANVHQWDYVAGANQQWKFEALN
ncbi:RICIN domain-containing protein [Butyrivibrio sp. MC2013]|uniref:RICIN domain-containing protein n=1 Tax=Butyrivibrio sp. MC2013 TaxID=1280686 RepID=UPI00040F5C46|nr:RICIN domain-containing protein [Butyrivibrio sp. MC2013]